jgi:hypothetical protein
VDRLLKRPEHNVDIGLDVGIIVLELANPALARSSATPPPATMRFTDVRTSAASFRRDARPDILVDRGGKCGVAAEATPGSPIFSARFQSVTIMATQVMVGAQELEPWTR